MPTCSDHAILFTCAKGMSTSDMDRDRSDRYEYERLGQEQDDGRLLSWTNKKKIIISNHTMVSILLTALSL